MKLIHLSDLHLGKRVSGFSMLEDQEYILTKIINVIDSEQPDAVLIAGDVYDKSIPPTEAVELFDRFLVRLAKQNLQVFIISGNHDSPERLAFGRTLMDASGIHLAPVCRGPVEPVTLTDQFGPVHFYLLPFVKPVHIRKYLDREDVSTYTQALRAAVEAMEVDYSGRNVLITHQFVTGASRSESEEISVGGTDNVDAEVFDGFDYVALGHLHAPQDIQSPRIRYCGSPLKYAFSETSHTNSVTVAELAQKGTLTARTAPLIPLRNMVNLRGSYEELTLKQFYQDTSWQEDYVHITLTDEEDILDAFRKLSSIYHNLMQLDYDNKRTRSNAAVDGPQAVEEKSEFDLFAEFYELQNNAPMSPAQSGYIHTLIEKIWGENE